MELYFDDGHVDEGDLGEGGGDPGAVVAAHAGRGEGLGRQEQCKVTERHSSKAPKKVCHRLRDLASWLPRPTPR